MQQNLKLSYHGMIGILFILLMFGIAFVLHWNIDWWYFVIALVLYTGAIILLTRAEEKATRQTTQTTGYGPPLANPNTQITEYGGYGSPAYQPYPNTDEKKLPYIFRWLLGCHLALLFLAVGLLLHFQDYVYRTLIGNIPQVLPADLFKFGYFIASVSGGLAIPFLLFRISQNKNSINPHGVIGILLIILMFGIAFFYGWNINWWYFIGAIALYAGASIALNLSTDFPSENGPPKTFFRARLGWHLAFIFLLVGFGLHFKDGGVNLGFFIASIAGGLVIPYLLFR